MSANAEILEGEKEGKQNPKNGDKCQKYQHLMLSKDRSQSFGSTGR